MQLRDLRAPGRGVHRRDLDVVLAAVDGLFETMHVHGCSQQSEMLKTASILRAAGTGHKRKDDRSCTHMQQTARIPNSPPQNFFRVTECPQGFHRTST